MTRMSTLFLRTLREDPADAEVPSHRLLVRAGYIRRAAPGIYTWLPLGLRVLRNVERDRARGDGRASAPRRSTSRRCCRASPTRPPAAGPSTATNIFRLKDRKGGDYLLGPDPRGDVHAAGEGPVLARTRTARSSLYQIQTKYRDEARPRAGLLRGREFVMKDSYSFDLDDDGPGRSRTTRTATPTSRSSTGSVCEYVIVSAMSGAMGGSASEEFLAESDDGEDTFVRCAAATTRPTSRRSSRPRRPRSRSTTRPPRTSTTRPDTPTIETLVDLPQRAIRAPGRTVAPPPTR